VEIPPLLRRSAKSLLRRPGYALLVVASAGWTFVRRTVDGAERVDARLVLGDFFATLGLDAEVGRLIPGDETGPGGTPVAVLGHGFWERAYGAESGVIGQALVLDDRPYQIVGVLPAGVGYPRPDVEVYTPMGVLAETLPWDTRGSSFGTGALARLAPGVDLASAQRDMNRVTDEVDALEGKSVVTAEVRPLKQAMLGGVERGLWLLRSSSSSWWPGPTWPTWRWRAARGGVRSWPCAVRWARDRATW